jgi:hypothetical protein
MQARDEPETAPLGAGVGFGKTRPARSAREAHVARFARQIGALGRAGRVASIANGAGLEENGGLLSETASEH